MDPADYPIVAESNETANAWDPAPLHECTSDRMLTIGRDTYGMKGLSKLDKAKRFIAVYDHMFQMENCDFCDGGSCNPTTHEHPAIAPRPFDKESSPEIPQGSPVGGPAAGRSSRTRSTAGTSPTHLIGLGDNSHDTPITDNVTHPLVTEQDNALTVTPEALAARVNQGGKI